MQSVLVAARRSSQAVFDVSGKLNEEWIHLALVGQSERLHLLETEKGVCWQMLTQKSKWKTFHKVNGAGSRIVIYRFFGGFLCIFL